MSVISYTFTCKDGSTFSHLVEIGKEYTQDDDSLPDWTRLEFNQCDVCQWDKTNRCPVSIAMQEPVSLLHKLPSYEEVDVEVKTKDRTYKHTVTAQEGLSSLFGLVMATSGCPAFTRFRGLAEFHLPFATMEETLFRNIAAHMMCAYFRGGTHSNDEVIADVKNTYGTIGQVNRGFIERIRNGVFMENDSSCNAIVILDAIGAMVAVNADHYIEELRPRFTD